MRYYEDGRVGPIRKTVTGSTEGPATWEILAFTLTDLGHKSALVAARWPFRRPDGSVVWEFIHSYTLCWLEGRWKFLARTLHD